MSATVDSKHRHGEFSPSFNKYILSICWVPVTLPGCVRYRADLNKIHGHPSLSHLEDSLDPCSSKCCPQTSTSDIA